MKQLNPLKFHLDKRSRVWDSNPESRCSDLVFYPSTNISGYGNTPSFSVNIDSYSSLGANIYTVDDVWVNGLIHSNAIDKTTYQQVWFIPDDLTLSEGYYYILLSVDGIDYYSDVFGVVADVSGLLKVKVSSADITVGGTEQKIQSLVTEFYLSADYYGIKPKTEEKGDPIDGITLVYSATTVFTHEFEIDANENIYRYLYSLRLLGCNGTIEITWDYDIFTASDILVEEIQNNNTGTYQIKLTFVDESESVQTLNAIT